MGSLLKILAKGKSVLFKGVRSSVVKSQRILKPIKAVAKKNPKLAKVASRVGIEGGTMAAGYGIAQVIGDAVAYTTDGDTSFAYSAELQECCSLVMNGEITAQNLVNALAQSNLDQLLPDPIANGDSLLEGPNGDDLDWNRRSDDWDANLDEYVDSSRSYGSSGDDYNGGTGKTGCYTVEALGREFRSRLHELNAVSIELEQLERFRRNSKFTRIDIRDLQRQMKTIKDFIKVCARVSTLATLSAQAIQSSLKVGPSVMSALDRTSMVLRSEGLRHRTILDDSDLDKILDDVLRDNMLNEDLSHKLNVLGSDASAELNVKQPPMYWLV